VFRIGSKSNHKIQTTGNKIMFPATIGHKLTKPIIISSKNSESTNINNRPSTNMHYIPTGLNRHK
jgi:hypothetical protein